MLAHNVSDHLCVCCDNISEEKQICFPTLWEPVCNIYVKTEKENNGVALANFDYSYCKYVFPIKTDNISKYF